MKKFILPLIALLLILVSLGCSSTTKSGIYERLISMDRSASELTPGSVDIGGISMSYLERPGSGDTIVLIHGFGANKDNWIRFVKYLPREYRVIAFDMPGHGDSSKPLDQTYSVDFFTASLAKAVDALKLGRFHLGGNSMGGYISMLYASREPDRVIDLCLLDPAGLFNVAPKPSDVQVAISQGRSPLAPKTKAEFDELLDYAFYKKPFMPWPVKSVLAQRAVESGPFVEKMFKDFSTHFVDLVPLLPGLHMPVLVVWGDHDRILDVSTADVIKKYIPASEVVIMKDCGHMPMLERPKETAGYYTAFLKSHKG